MQARLTPGARFPDVALFDLDGTLLDSAPDMLATVNAMRAERGRVRFAHADLAGYSVFEEAFTIGTLVAGPGGRD